MRAVAVAFTGSGEELRRHSRRDFLINVVLGGLYTPVARRHTADYLASRTTIDGAPIEHVPVARRRWPAIVLVAAFVALRVADEFGHGPPLPLLIVGAVLFFPVLWTTAAARTIDAIRWRGMRLTFEAPMAEVYRASWPLLVLGVAWAFAQPQVAARASAASMTDLQWLLGTAAAAAVAWPLLAWLAFNLRRLRFAHTRLAQAPIAWAARLPAYLRQCFLSGVVLLATAVAPVLLLRTVLFGSLTLQRLPVTEAALVYGAAFVLLLALSAPARAWHEARMHVLTWDGLRVTGTARIDCVLDVRAFVRLRTLDAWRTIATLGWHRPQAVVRAYQAKLASLRVWVE
jgi:uncharacterized membrane protein YjgN (DUF898 family)